MLDVGAEASTARFLQNVVNIEKTHFIVPQKQSTFSSLASK